MANIGRIIARVQAGEKPYFWMDHYGGQWIELRGSLMFWRRERIRLSSAEVDEIKVQLRRKRRTPGRARYAAS